MGKAHSPRNGSMQFWPRKRSKRAYTRIGARPFVKEAGLVEFAGYKAGMTRIIIKDTDKNSLTKNMNIPVPVTIIECPNIKIAGVRFHTKKGYGTEVLTELRNPIVSKELSKRLTIQKKKADFEKSLAEINIDDVTDISLLVYTEPKKTGIGKKKPDVMEVAIGGTDIPAKIEFVKTSLDKELTISDVFKNGQFIDVHGVTKGKGVQGAVKRFGIDLRAKKSEKTKRGAGSLGPWKAQGHVMYRIPAAGKMGYHSRVDYNKKIMLISDKPEDVNPIGGIINYGEVKSSYILVKGSIPGHKKRLIRLVGAIRADPKANSSAMAVTKFVKKSQQGC